MKKQHKKKKSLKTTPMDLKKLFREENKNQESNNQII